MNVQITDWTDKQSCLWCSKERECVTVDFDDSFLQKAPLCWPCLQNAIRVRSRQSLETQKAGKPNSSTS